MKKVLSFDEINNLAVKIADFIEENENIVIALIGELGSGKTSFSKSFAKGLGVKESLKSPTFNYVLEYLSGRAPLYHFDVYRIEEAEEIYEIGYEEYVNSGISLIEWADKIESELPKEYIRIDFQYSTESEEKREIKLSYMGNKEREEALFKYVGFGN